MNDNDIDCAGESGRVNLVVVMIWSADGTDGSSQIVHGKKTRVFGSRQFIVLRYSISALRYPLHAQTADHTAADFQSYCLLKSYFTHQHTGMLRSLKKKKIESVIRTTRTFVLLTILFHPAQQVLVKRSVTIIDFITHTTYQCMGLGASSQPSLLLLLQI